MTPAPRRASILPSAEVPFPSLQSFLAAAAHASAAKEAEARLRAQLSRPGAHPWLQPDGETVVFAWFDDGMISDTRGEPEAFLSTNYHRWPGRDNGHREGLPMVRVPGTGVLFRAERLPKNARVHYRFWVADVAEPAPSGEATGDLANVAVRDRLEVDPFNPRWEDNAFGARSIWAMPDFHEPEFVRARPAAADPERRREFVWKSDALDNKRPMAVYLPPDFDATSEKRYPLLLVHDGLEYAEDHRGLPRTLDYLIRQGAMEPVIAAFLPPLERNEEYRESEAFPRAIVEELVPMLGRDYPLSDRPGVHACLGLSYGALISAYLCGRWPSLFGRGVFHAGAYAGQAFRRIADRAAAGELHYPGRYFLGCGSFDYLYPHHLILKGVFEGLGVQFLNRETAEGHEWDAWIAADGEALPFVFPPE